MNQLIEKWDMITDKHLILFKDIIRYGLVSVLAMVVDVGMLYIFVEHIRMNYMYATTIAFCFGLVFHYILVKIFVFRISRITPFKEFFWYVGIGLIGLILNNLIIYILVWMHLWYIYAKFVSVFVVFFFNFYERRRLFRN